MNLIAFLCAGMAAGAAGFVVYALVVLSRDRRDERRKADRRRAPPRCEADWVREYREARREACRECGIGCESA